MDNDYILKVENLHKDFGGVKALDDFNMEVKNREIHGLIGPNGAGKSTFFNILNGFLSPDKGKIFFNNKEIEGLPPEERVKMGIARTFQKSNIVSEMSVMENVMAGMYLEEDDTPIKSFFKNHFSLFTSEKNIRKKSLEVLNFVGLSDYENRWSDELVWVERQLLQLARSIVSEPDLLLLDEPAAGMGKKERDKIINVINDIRSRGITIIVISHNLEMIMDLCEKISVIDSGNLLFSGTPEEVTNNSKVMEAYTGEK